MARWKKIVLWAIAITIISIVVCLALLSHALNNFAKDMCGTFIVQQIPSPNKKIKAVLFQFDCGATTGFNSHVAIVPINEDITKNSDAPSFFGADTRNGSAPAGEGGGPEVRIIWQSDTELQIQHHRLARISKAETSTNGVAINYLTFR